MTKLSGSLPKEDRNGIGHLVGQFVEDPTRRHVLIAVVDTAKVTQNVDTGDEEPTLRILRVEQIRPEDAASGERLMRRAMQERTGQSTLALYLADEISAIFQEASLDRRTGETHITLVKPDVDASDGDS